MDPIMMNEKYSFGIILRHDNKYLIVQNRDTEAFIYFFFSNVPKWTPKYCMKVFKEFTIDEKNRLLYYPFHELYLDLYVCHDVNKFKNKYNIAKRNYEFFHENKWMKNILISSSFKHANWLFPKGRIEKNETEIDCAVREFFEETNISLNNYKDKIDVSKYIIYKQFKMFYRFNLINKLFILDVPKQLDIKYTYFPNIIRPLSISNEILHAMWVDQSELHYYLPFYIFEQFRHIIS
jgi:8-oxo-dGTP pyrophosphatase MutT (NUDIX family)